MNEVLTFEGQYMNDYVPFFEVTTTSTSLSIQKLELSPPLSLFQSAIILWRPLWKFLVVPKTMLG